MMFQIENQYFYGLKILSETASFQPHKKWAWKTLHVAIIDSPVLKDISTINAYIRTQTILKLR